MDEDSCIKRCGTNVPSSTELCTTITDDPWDCDKLVMSNLEDMNPPFHDFYRVYGHYCDSGLWASTLNETTFTSNEGESAVFSMRGKFIFQAILEDLFTKTFPL